MESHQIIINEPRGGVAVMGLLALTGPPPLDAVSLRSRYRPKSFRLLRSAGYGVRACVFRARRRWRTDGEPTTIPDRFPVFSAEVAVPFTVHLEFTPLCPQAGLPFTEESFARRSIPFTFEVGEVGVALVDLWNFGWEDGPVGETLGPDLSFERGRSHALRKRRITEEVIAPTVDRLPGLGVQVFHCTHAWFLEPCPQWEASTTTAEREAARPRPAAEQARDTGVQTGETSAVGEAWPPREWAAVLDIEARFGYLVTSAALVGAVASRAA